MVEWTFTKVKLSFALRWQGFELPKDCCCCCEKCSSQWQRLTPRNNGCSSVCSSAADNHQRCHNHRTSQGGKKANCEETGHKWTASFSFLSTFDLSDLLHKALVCVCFVEVLGGQNTQEQQAWLEQKQHLQHFTPPGTHTRSIVQWISNGSVQWNVS